MLGERGVTEIIGLCGYYTMVSMTLNTFRVRPAGAAKFRSCVRQMEGRSRTADPSSLIRRGISQAARCWRQRRSMPDNHPYHRRNAHRACSSQGRRSRSRAGVLLRRARLRADAAAEFRRGVHFGRRLSSPYRPEYLGKQRRPSAAAGNDRVVSHRDPLSDPAGAGRRAASRDRGRHPLDGASDHGVSEALYLRDPDENGVELYWDRPKEQWPRTADGALAMFTHRLDLDELLRQREA